MANPLSNLLQNDVSFDFGKRFKDAFDTLNSSTISSNNLYSRKFYQYKKFTKLPYSKRVSITSNLANSMLMTIGMPFFGSMAWKSLSLKVMGGIPFYSLPHCID